MFVDGRYELKTCGSNDEKMSVIIQDMIDIIGDFEGH
jgi:hypothetical protein